MGLFLTGGLLTALVITILLRPLLVSSASSEQRDRESGIYQDQLDEVSRDLARGVINDEQARSARTEIERRLLTTLRRQEETTETVNKASRMGAIIAIAAMPILASGLYLQIGAPDQPNFPFASQSPSAEARHTAPGTPSETHIRIAALQERLSKNPGDIEGQVLLAQSYASLGQFPEALSAYRIANQLSEGRNHRLAGEHAEIMVLANNGVVPESAKAIFSLIKKDYADDPQAIYFLALAKAQDSDEAGAISDLRALRQSSPDDAPWLGAVNDLLWQLDQNASTGTAPAQEDVRFGGPTPAAVAAAAQLSIEEQDAMIANMVASLASRLADNPDDIQGWRRLAQAYEVLGKSDNAAAAHREVLARAPNDSAAKAFLNNNRQ